MRSIAMGMLLGLAGTAAAAQSSTPCPFDTPAGSRCGTIDVPEKAPGGRMIPIRYLVVPAERGPAREAVILMAGGPGQGGTDMVGLVGVLAEVRRSRDILMVDQRGTGGSNPLICPTDAAERPAVAFGHVFDPAVTHRCRGDLERRADLSRYTTDLAVTDFEAVRAALGYEKVLLWGGSYGTRMAQAYLRAHPDRVRAVVLDGVVPFDFRAPAGYAASVQQSLDRVMADCRAWPACRDSFPSFAADFAALGNRLSAGPIPATVVLPDSSRVTVPFGAGDFGYAVRGLLYGAAGARLLPGMVAQAAQSGDLSPFAQRYWDRVVGLEGFADGLHFSIFCAEDVPFIRDEEVAGLVRGSFIGRYLIDEYRGACRGWVRAPFDRERMKPVTADVPVLLLSGWFDPVTPPETAARVAAALPRARHIVVRNQAHGSGFGCARPAVLHVLTTGTLDGLPEVCAGVTNLFER